MTLYLLDKGNLSFRLGRFDPDGYSKTAPYKNQECKKYPVELEKNIMVVGINQFIVHYLGLY